MSHDKAMIVDASTAGLFAAYLLAKERIPVQAYHKCETRASFLRHQSSPAS